LRILQILLPPDTRAGAARLADRRGFSTPPFSGNREVGGPFKLKKGNDSSSEDGEYSNGKRAQREVSSHPGIVYGVAPVYVTL